MANTLLLIDSVAPPTTEADTSQAPPAAFRVLLDLACAIAAGAGANVRVLSVIEAGADQSLSTVALAAQERRRQVAAWNRAAADALRAELVAAGLSVAGGADPLPDIQP